MDPKEKKVKEEEKESVRIELTRNGDKYEQNTDYSGWLDSA